MGKGLVGGVVLAALVVSGLAACGDDDDGGAIASATTEVTTAADASGDDDGGPLVETKVEGPHEAPDYPAIDDAPKGADLEAALGDEVGEPDPTPAADAPTERSPMIQERGGSQSGTAGGTGFAGLQTIYQYDNFAPSPVDSNRSCGQAAVATALTAWGKMKPASSGQPVTTVWNKYGPNVAFGLAGTGWDQVDRALKGFGMKTYMNRGLTDLKAQIKAGRPSLVMVDVGAVSRVWGGHWVVAYAYDKDGIYVTNWNFNGSPYINYLSNSDFNKAWNGNIPQLGGFAGWFITPWA
jgi:hypothetical protein